MIFFVLVLSSLVESTVFAMAGTLEKLGFLDAFS